MATSEPKKVKKVLHRDSPVAAVSDFFRYEPNFFGVFSARSFRARVVKKFTFEKKIIWFELLEKGTSQFFWSEVAFLLS